MINHGLVRLLEADRSVLRSDGQPAGKIPYLNQLQGSRGMASRQKPPKEKGRRGKERGFTIQTKAETKRVRARISINTAITTNPVGRQSAINTKQILQRAGNIFLPRGSHRGSNRKQGRPSSKRKQGKEGKLQSKKTGS
jgi:hypothetical protein